jgi:hypothetical protein
MMFQGVPAKELIEHCEKFMFTYRQADQGGASAPRFVVRDVELNNMEKAMAFDYLFHKLRKQAQDSKAEFFNPTVFLAIISSLTYSLLKAHPTPLLMCAYEATMNLAIEKILKLHNWFESGQPPDDANLVDEVVELMNSNRERMQPIMEMLNTLMAKKGGK